MCFARLKMNEEKGPLLVVITVILFISSLFIPFILVFLLQEIFYFSGSHNGKIIKIPYDEVE